MIVGARWAIVLAAGEGSRLRLLTTDDHGVPVPKQFCSLRGGASLLELALARAERHVPRERVVVVVASHHETFWRGQLQHLPPQNVVVQPSNRGTAVGLLLPLLRVLAQDPEPSVLVLPSDHHVADEATLAGSLQTAMTTVARGEAGTVLIGIVPASANSDYGWIVPGPGGGLVRPVHAFVEKPTPTVAQALLAQGGIWNSFLFAARGRALRDLIEREAPGLGQSIAQAVHLGGDTLDRVYGALPKVDLSHDVFARAPEALRVLRAPACGWTDLGTPQRVIECLAHQGNEGSAVPHRGVSVNLLTSVRGKSAIA